MTDPIDIFEYECAICGFHNVWTRDEILRNGTKSIFMSSDDDYDVYVLDCRNPKITCSGQHMVKVPKE